MTAIVDIPASAPAPVDAAPLVGSVLPPPVAGLGFGLDWLGTAQIKIKGPLCIICVYM